MVPVCRTARLDTAKSGFNHRLLLAAVRVETPAEARKDLRRCASPTTSPELAKVNSLNLLALRRLLR
jgi:hypothetical protein